MSSDDRAVRLAENLQTVLDAAEKADREDPALSEKLSPQEVRVLRCVGRTDCPIMSAIAGAIRLSLSSVTGLIDRLCEKNLVRRDRSTQDRRIVQVELTDEGRTLHRAAQETRVAFARDLLKGLSQAEQEQLVGLLGKASENLQG